MKLAISQAKSFEDMESFIDGWERGKIVFDSVCAVISRRGDRYEDREPGFDDEEEVEERLCTPNERIGLIPLDVLETPRWPVNPRRLPMPFVDHSPTPDSPIRLECLRQVT